MTEDFNYDEIAFQAEQNAPDISDENFPRFAMSFFLPVPLYRQDGNNSYGDFNKKGENGANVVNYNYYPPFILMPLLGGTFDIPYENRPTESEEPVEAAPFDYGVFKSQPKNGFSSVVRSPKQCAEVFERECGVWGGRVFSSLIGYHVSEKDKGLAAARYLVNQVMPYGDKEIFPRTVRTRAGMEFKGPFLDELYAFVEKKSMDRIKAANLSPSDKEVAGRLRGEIWNYLSKATQLANRVLNETEDEINDPKGLKRTYDTPNLDVDDAPQPTDLYALVHTNRIEMDMKQLEASKTIGEGLSNPMVKVAEKITEVLERMDSKQVPASVPKDVMTGEQVEEMLKRQREELMKEFENKFKAFTAPAQNSETKTPEDAGNAENVDEPKQDAKTKNGASGKGK